MDNEFLNQKNEIEKINQRIKEYIKKKKHLFNIRRKK